MRSFGKLLSCSFALALFVTSAHAAEMSKNDTSLQDTLSKIHTVNQNEINMAKMALEKGQSNQVKSFAQRMIKDHSMADQKVMNLAKQEKLTLTKYPLTASEQGQMDQLNASSGNEFDRLYMEANRKGHDQALTMLKDSERQVTDPKAKKLISQLIPKVAHHDKLARNIRPEQRPAS